MSKTKTRGTVKAALAIPPVSAAKPDQKLPLAFHSNVHSTIGRVVGTTTTAQTQTAVTCLVTYPENPSNEAQTALVLSHVPAVMPGQSVLLHFVGADLTRPVVLGVVAGASTTEIDRVSPAQHLPTQDLSNVRVVLENQEVLTLMATKQLVLRCGQASIVLQEDGTIEIRGSDVTSRASGQNAVRGASVSLN